MVASGEKSVASKAVGAGKSVWVTTRLVWTFGIKETEPEKDDDVEELLRVDEELTSVDEGVGVCLVEDVVGVCEDVGEVCDCFVEDDVGGGGGVLVLVLVLEVDVGIGDGPSPVV